MIPKVNTNVTLYIGVLVRTWPLKYCFKFFHIVLYTHDLVETELRPSHKSKLRAEIYLKSIRRQTKEIDTRGHLPLPIVTMPFFPPSNFLLLLPRTLGLVTCTEFTRLFKPEYLEDLNLYLITSYFLSSQAN